MEKKLKEIRLSNWGLPPELGSRFGALSGAVAWQYLKELGTYMIDDTHVLVIFLYEENFCSEKVERYKKGEKGWGFLGETNCYFSIDAFLKLENNGKRLFLLDLIHETCLRYMSHFNLPVDPLLNAYEKVCNSDFFIAHSDKRILSKNKKYELVIDIKVDYELKTYRLHVINRKDNNKKSTIICTKNIFFPSDMPGLTINQLLKIPRSLQLDGWINANEYQMSWGEEKYIYNIEKEILSTVG